MHIKIIEILKRCNIGKYFIRREEFTLKNNIFAIVKHQEYLDVHQPSFVNIVATVVR